MKKTNAEHQNDFRERREKEGLTRKEYWATDGEHTYLKSTLIEMREGKAPSMMTNEIKISELIEILSDSKDTFGDLSIVTGNKVLKNGSREASAPAVGVSWDEDGKPVRFFIL